MKGVVAFYSVTFLYNVDLRPHKEFMRRFNQTHIYASIKTRFFLLINIFLLRYKSVLIPMKMFYMKAGLVQQTTNGLLLFFPKEMKQMLKIDALVVHYSRLF